MTGGHYTPAARRCKIMRKQGQTRKTLRSRHRRHYEGLLGGFSTTRNPPPPVVVVRNEIGARLGAKRAHILSSSAFASPTTARSSVLPLAAKQRPSATSLLMRRASDTSFAMSTPLSASPHTTNPYPNQTPNLALPHLPMFPPSSRYYLYLCSLYLPLYIPLSLSFIC